MSDASDIPTDGPERDDLLAAELSLGLLTGDELSQTARRARIDPVFADRVADWDARFAQMTDSIAPVTPPKGIWRKITNEAYPESPKRIWQQLGILPAFFGAAAAALVFVLALQIGALMQPDVPGATLTARMEAQDNSLIVAANFVPESGTLVVEWEEGERIEGRDVELWLIAGDNAPVSLGVLNKGTPLTQIQLPADVQLALVGGTLAVSDEPLGGSPTGAPTGDIMALGAVTAL